MKPSMALRFAPERSRAEILDDLRRLLPRLENPSGGNCAFSFGLPALDAHLPKGGLAGGALHEVVPESEGDLPAAFGFAAALLGRMPSDGPMLFVISPSGLADCGHPHGHGLDELGLTPARLILVETEDEVQALWAMEEALRSAVPSAVAGAIGQKLDLKASRRLHLAAGNSGCPLILLSAAAGMGSSAAATRWCVGAAKAARDRFGLPAHWRWRLRLERCRNGRLGEWLVEWDHVAYRFSLAAPMADLAIPRGTSPRFQAPPRLVARAADRS
ncbi:MAG: ImuA protein [Hyphomicrobiales bacterium]|nr:ImuA protein [Hyphomicrobiales bacterium]